MPSDNEPTKLSFCRVRKSDRERFKPTISHSVFPSDSTAMIAPFVISQRDLSPKLTTCQNKRKDCTLIWSFFFSNLPSVSWWEQKETKVFRVLNICFFGSSSLQPKDERMIYRRAQSMLKLPANCYSYCFRTVDGPSAILFIPDSHCFFLPGPFSLDSRDCIFEWVYSVLIAFLSIFFISPLSFHLVLHHVSNTADLKVMADSSAVPLLQCTVRLLTLLHYVPKMFSTCSRLEATYVPNSAMFSTPSRHGFQINRYW